MRAARAADDGLFGYCGREPTSVRIGYTTMNVNRREFILGSLTLAAAGLLPVDSQSAQHPIGIQAYTVRTLAEKDLPRVLAELKKIGYEEIELYWNLYSRPAGELRKMLDDH